MRIAAARSVLRTLAAFAVAAFTLASGAAPEAHADPPSRGPDAPSHLEVTTVDAVSVSLAWKQSNSKQVSEYGLYVGSKLVGSATTTSATLSGLACATTYTFGVDAVNSTGQRSAITAVNGTTSACADTTPPTVPANVTQTAATETSITLSWIASTDNVGVAAYGVYKNGTFVGATVSPGYTLSDLVCGTSYTLGVDAFDAAGNRSAVASVTASTAACVSAPPPSSDTSAPIAPTGLTLGAATETSLALHWSPSFDNVGVSGYGLYRDGVRVGQTTLTSYTFAGLTCGKSYTLAVDAYDAAGNRSASASVIASTAACVVVPAPDVSPPQVALTAPAAGSTVRGTITLDVSASDNVGVTQVKYLLDGAEIGEDSTTPDWSESWDSATVADGTHSLVARARDAAGNWGTSAPVSLNVDNVPDGGSTANPLTCEGYPEPRVFLESQSWWRQTPGSNGTDFGHVHSGVCFPYLQTLRGQVSFDVRTLMHDNPDGRLRTVRVQAFNDAYGTKTLLSVALDKPCGSHDCTFWTSVTVDTSLIPNDGLTEFRIHSEVRDPDGSDNLATNGFLAYVSNGKPRIDTEYLAPHRTEGRGWYRLPDGTELGYENARVYTQLPTGSVSGIWKVEVGTERGSNGAPITHSLVTVDPNFHAVPENRGTILVDQAGPFRGVVEIDTTKLANGKHKLVIIGSAARTVGSTLSGVLVVPFTIQNG